MENKQELKSNKVQNIIEQIPSSILRYGIIVIASTLIILTIMASMIPYGTTYNGDVSFSSITRSKDSINCDIQIQFIARALDGESAQGQQILIKEGHLIAHGKIISLSDIRNNHNQQKAVVRFWGPEIEPLENTNASFSIHYIKGNLLNCYLGFAK